MTDDEIRAVIRDVLTARGLGPADARQTTPYHVSQVRLSMVAPTPAGSPCVIEPSVGCTQCGYCVSMGH
jgi:hypothetical protein